MLHCMAKGLRIPKQSIVQKTHQNICEISPHLGLQIILNMHFINLHLIFCVLHTIIIKALVLKIIDDPAVVA